MILQAKLAALVALVALSGFFSGSETAFFSLSSLRAKYLLSRKAPGAGTVNRLKKNPQRLLTTILIGNNLVNVAASALAASIAFEFSVSYAVSITTGIMTLVILVFGEIMPKSFAIKHNERISLAVSMPMLALQTAFFPVVVVFEALSNALTGRGIKRPAVTEEEIKAFVSIGEKAGEIKESERKMIHRIFMFNDIEAKDVMTPRNRIVALPADTKVGEAVRIFPKKGHSRIPVYEKGLDNITGFVHAMDAQKAKKSMKVKSIARPILFVPSSTKLDSLLKFFQRKKQHMAVVVDEFGTNVGIVTTEDAVEEIVGEIIDETEKIEPMVKKVSRNSYLVEGRADIDEINEKCGVNIKAEEPYTISSFILKQTGRLPEEGETIKFPGCEITVKAMEKNEIRRVLIKRQKLKSRKASK